MKGITDDNIKNRAILEIIMPIFLIIYCFFTMIFTTGLMIYHTSLIWRNQTTKEELKNSFKNIYSNPYTRGILKNVKRILCPKLNNPDILDKIRNKIALNTVNNQLKEKEKEKYLNQEIKKIVKEEEKIINEKVNGNNKTNSHSDDYQKKREQNYYDNNYQKENANNKNILSEEKLKKDKNGHRISGKNSINEEKDKQSKIDKKELSKELNNSDIKVIFGQKKNFNQNEKSIEFNLQESLEVNQEGIINSNIQESKSLFYF